MFQNEHLCRVSYISAFWLCLSVCLYVSVCLSVAFYLLHVPSNILLCIILLEPPVWIPDIQSHSCSFCQEKFNLIRRRHHCRNCGKVQYPTSSSSRHLFDCFPVISCSVVSVQRISSVCLISATTCLSECVLPATSILSKRVTTQFI